jgi:ATP-dependent protease ClpP protease subunit
MAGFALLRPDVWSLFGPINSQSMTGLWKAMLLAKPTNHVCLLLDSEGGEVANTLGFIHETQKRLPKFEIRVVGEACSAAVHLIQAATLRTCVPSARFYTHAMSTSPEVHPADVYQHARDLRGLHKHWINTLVERTDHDERFWSDWLRQGILISASTSFV